MRRERLSITILLLLTAAFLSLGRTAIAQLTAAAIHGTVTDSSGAVVPNARVTALNTATGIATTVITDKSGYYTMPQLQVGGPYTVSVTASGFQSSSTSGVTLDANANREVSAALQVGTAATTVQVMANAVQVETSNTQLEQIATAEQLESIPLEGRDPAGLQKLEPGVVESSDRFGNFSSNGNQTPQNNYVVDGIDINDGPLQTEGIQVNPDALQEENIVTSTMNPEFARNSGAVINQVIKAGSNSIHGSGFEFYRDTFMNNGNYFSLTRPIFHQNLYGGTVGGPFLRNKLFFFVGYQGYRNRTGATDQATTLDSDQLNGQFSSDPNFGTAGTNNQPITVSNTPLSTTNPPPNTIYCPASEVPAGNYTDSLSCSPTPFSVNGMPAGTPWIIAFNNGEDGPSNVSLPTSTWNKLASTIISKYVPPANSGTDLYNFNELNTAAADQADLRLDYTITPSDTIWASSVIQSSPSTNSQSFGGGSFPGFGMHASEHFKIFSASYTHAFSADMLNELHAGYYRINYPSVIPTPVQTPSSLGFDISPQLALSGVPYMSIGGYFALGNSYEGPQPRTDTNATYGDNFTWVKGNHTLKFGGSFEQFRVHNPFGYLNNGYYNWDGSGPYSSGDPLIDFTMGIPDGYEQANDGFIDAVASETYLYGQDSWKLTSDLTVNYGVALDAEQPNQNKQFGGLGVVCFQITNNTSKVFPGGPPGLFYNGDPGCNEAGGPTTHWNRIGPRIGIAWSPSEGPSAFVGRQGAHDLSIRAGFGVYYNRDQEEQSLQNLVDPPVFYTSHGAGDFGGSPSFANPYTDVAGNGSEANPFPFATPTAGSTVNWSIYNFLGQSAFSPNYSVPYTYNFNLNIQRAIGPSLIAQVGYVGSLSHRLATWTEGDPITPAGHAACLSNPLCSANPADIHLFFPQYTAQPAIVPGTAGGGYVGNGVPWFTSIGEQETEGSSNYNSLQVFLRQTPHHGLQFTLGYTYSHALDNGSGYESQTGGDGGYGDAGHVYNYVAGFSHLNYGSSDFDARQRIVASYEYVIPAAGFLRDNLILRDTLSGWGVSGLTALQSGNPVSISMGADRSYWCDGSSYFGCADVPETSSFNIKTMNIRSASHQYFDTTPFSPEPLGTFGNTGRDFFHGPGFNYTNLALTKNIPFTSDSAKYVQLRLEAFNAFNHANFAPPNGDFNNPQFGTVTSVVVSADPNGDPSPGRAVQIAGKVYF
jgi:Carboxypeptidase regulatory-like domain